MVYVLIDNVNRIMQHTKVGLLFAYNFHQICRFSQGTKYVGFHRVQRRSGIGLYVPCNEKTGLRGFRLAPTQTGLYNHRRGLEA